MKLYEIVVYGASKDIWTPVSIGYFLDEALAKKYFDRYNEQKLYTNDFDFFLYEHDIITEEPPKEFPEPW